MGTIEKKGMYAAPFQAALRDFHPYCQHQFLEAHQVEHPFEIVNQRRQAPFPPDFLQPLSKKCVYPNQRLMVPNGCSASFLRNLNFQGCAFIRAIASIDPSFASRVIVRLALFRVHCLFNAQPLQPLAR